MDDVQRRGAPKPKRAEVTKPPDNPLLMVVGFLFSAAYRDVLLIQKKRPAWQKGYLNGIGGHVTDKETPLEAMIREFREEAGLGITTWEHYATLTGVREERPWEVQFFHAKTDIPLYAVHSVTDEKLQTGSIHHLHHCKTLSNLQWLIPMAIDHARETDVAALMPFHQAAVSYVGEAVNKRE